MKILFKERAPWPQCCQDRRQSGENLGRIPRQSPKENKLSAKIKTGLQQKHSDSSFCNPLLLYTQSHHTGSFHPGSFHPGSLHLFGPSTLGPSTLAPTPLLPPPWLPPRWLPPPLVPPPKHPPPAPSTCSLNLLPQLAPFTLAPSPLLPQSWPFLLLLSQPSSLNYCPSTHVCLSLS